MKPYYVNVRLWTGKLERVLVVPFLMILTVAILSGCARADNAFRSEFKSVAFTGSYSNAGQSVGAGVRLGIRPPEDKSK